MITPSSKPRIYFNEIRIGTDNVRRSNSPRHFRLFESRRFPNQCPDFGNYARGMIFLLQRKMWHSISRRHIPFEELRRRFDVSVFGNLPAKLSPLTIGNGFD